MERIGDVPDVLITCTPPSLATNNTLKCDIGNPLPSGRTANFKVILTPTPVRVHIPSYSFHMEVNSTNPESDATNYDNIIQKTISIWVDTNLSVKGVTVEPTIHYNISEYLTVANASKEEELGPHMVNLFEITNNGPSAIEEAEVYIVIPYETNAGDKLMYLLNQPETSGNIKCEPNTMANTMRLQLNTELMHSSFLESQGAVEKGFSSHSSLASSSSSSSSSSSVSRSSNASGGGAQLSRADFESASGDSSHINQHRANQASNHFSSSSSSSSSSKNNGPQVTYSASYNRSSHRGTDGKLHTFESSTEYYGSGGGSAAQRHQAAAIQQQRVGGGSQYSSQGSQQHRAQSGGNVRLEDETVGRVIIDQSSASGQQSNQGNRFTASSSSASAAGTASSSGRRRMYSQQDGEANRNSDFLAASSDLEKIAQGGRGFQVGSLDVLRRNNVDDELRSHGVQSSASQGRGFAGSGQQQHHSSNHQQQSWQSGQSSGSTNDGFAPSSNVHDTNGFQDNEDEYYYDEEQEEAEDDADQQQHHQQNHSYNQQQQQQHQRASSSSSSSRSNSHLAQANNGEHHLKHYPRNRRNSPSVADFELNEALSCNRTKCIVLRCVAGPLENNGNAWIAIRARLVAHTMTLVIIIL